MSQAEIIELTKKLVNLPVEDLEDLLARVYLTRRKKKPQNISNENQEISDGWKKILQTAENINAGLPMKLPKTAEELEEMTYQD